MRRVSASVIFTSLLAIGTASFAQSPEGAIVGRVDDITGARVAGAHIEVDSLASGMKRGATTDKRGEFTVEFLPPGRYRVTVSAAGFDPAVSSIYLPINFSQALVVTLRPATRRESVNVQGTGSSLTTRSTRPLGSTR